MLRIKSVAPTFRAAWIATLLLLLFAVSVSAKEKVILDVDMGQLNDDAVAMFMLIQSGEVDLLGVTVVAGNTWVEEGVAYTLRQLEIIGHSDIPVVPGAVEPLMGSRQAALVAEQRLYGNVEYMGAYARPRPNSYRELASAPYQGYPVTQPLNQHAVDFIIDQVKRYPGEVNLFVLGPATNIALAVRKAPEIVPLIKRVIYMGGAIDVPGNTSPAAEFNWWFDPEAIKIALRTPFKEQIIVPLDIAERVYYTKREYDRIVSAKETPIVKMFKDLQGPRFAQNPEYRSFVWDALTSAIFLRPQIATRIEERFIDIDTNYGPNYGRSIGYHESRNRTLSNPDNYPVGSQRVKILFDIDQEAFWDLYVELMTK